ncbi:MAG: prepilin-type N-terminal cleavage/methylation domain-containing protein, partial [Burkholderiaceae bacterium]|nr:prepilin-type N-terminal cleavage/methylation domain-containing protein [Burkholderiaceae bacterium]
MRILAAGSRPVPTLATSWAAAPVGQAPRACQRRSTGFTLLELLVVVAIIAIGTAGVSLALRDASASSLEREAQRLAALL